MYITRKFPFDEKIVTPGAFYVDGGSLTLPDRSTMGLGRGGRCSPAGFVFENQCRTARGRSLGCGQ